MKVDRLVSMIMLLLDKERVAARELAQLFEVSPRTIYRDMDAISAAGIPVRSVPGVGGGFAMMREYKVDRKVFTTADLSAILTGLSSLSHMTRGNELGNAIAKVRSLVPTDKIKDVEDNVSQIDIDLTPWMGSRNMQPALEIIKTALQEKRLLSFTYTDGHGNQTARTAEPYQLVWKGSQWYWQGYCHSRSDYRLFKLSRTSNLIMREEIFIPRDNPKPQLDFSEPLAAMQTRIKLRIHKSIMDRVLDYCSYENCSPDGNEHYTVNFPFIHNDYHYEILLGFGNRCECLEPPCVRAEMKRRIREIAALYEN